MVEEASALRLSTTRAWNDGVILAPASLRRVACTRSSGPSVLGSKRSMRTSHSTSSLKGTPLKNLQSSRECSSQPGWSRDTTAPRNPQATVIGRVGVPWMTCASKKVLPPLRGHFICALTVALVARGATGGKPQFPTRHWMRSGPGSVRRAATCTAPPSRGMICTPIAWKCAFSAALTIPPSHGPKHSARPRHCG